MKPNTRRIVKVTNIFPLDNGDTNIIQKRNRKKSPPKLDLYYPDHEQFSYEICVDEAGRGPLFGRVYIAAVVVPRDGTFQTDGIMDSKLIKSTEKLRQLAERIRKEAIAWHITYLEPDEIDNINILNATLNGMHECVRNVCLKLEESNPNKVNSQTTAILVDGNQFKPYCYWNENTQTIDMIPHQTVEHGDSLYIGIASASILAKHAHDSYIWDLCEQYPELDEKYKLKTNVGYGTKHHLDGIKEHGITQWHRKTFGICKTAIVNSIN